MNQSNIICIVSPYHRWQDLGCHGNRDIRTPYLDALEKHGMSFTQSFAASANPAESRYTHLLGSTYPTDTPTLPQRISNAGYQTGFIGTWQHEACTLDSLDFTWTDCFDSSQTDSTKNENDKDCISTKIGDQAVRFLQDTRSPFFLYLSFNHPQRPFDPPMPWRNKYKPDALTLPPEASQLPPDAQKTCRDELADYYALITHLDNQIGRILATLSSRGHTNNTIIYSGLRGIDWSHDDDRPLESNLRVPFIISGVPGQRHGETDASLTTSADLAPTILDLCNLNPDSGITGSSLAKHLFDAHTPKKNAVCAQWDARTRYARNERYKLIESTEADSNALYDVQDDPNEKNNLLGSPKHIVHQVKLSQDIQTGLDTRNE